MFVVRVRVLVEEGEGVQNVVVGALEGREVVMCEVVDESGTASTEGATVVVIEHSWPVRVLVAESRS